jgi:hypothetical protein
MTISKWMKDTGACAEARAWAKPYKTLSAAWAACTNPGWMLWALGKIDGGKTDQRYRLLACRFVRETPLHDGRKVWDLLTDPRSRAAIEVAERYAKGEATDIELEAAGDAAWAAAGAAAWDAARAARAAAGAASDAASDAARDAAGDAAGAAAWAAAWDAAWGAAWAAAGAASDAAGDAAGADARAAQCNIIREVFGDPFAVK